MRGAFTISAMWYTIGYKRLEIMCIHLEGGLDGAAEVNEAARWDNSVSHDGVFGADYISLGGPATLSYNYLSNCGIKIVNPIVFKAAKWVLVAVQIIFAGACIFMLMN